jgi:hypothetical protein
MDNTILPARVSSKFTLAKVSTNLVDPQDCTILVFHFITPYVSNSLVLLTVKGTFRMKISTLSEKARKETK